MRRRVLSLNLLAMMLLLLACAQRQQQAAAAPEPQPVEAVTEDLAPDFELPDLQGNPLKLSSLRGKYVIIDFWGAWCVWCIRGIPSMKEAYTKYKDKMEILGVDCNDSEEAWRKAVAQYELPWLQVRCPEESQESLFTNYNIEGFPTKVVIAPDGKIAKVVVGEDPAFYTFLDELFAQ